MFIVIVSNFPKTLIDFYVIFFKIYNFDKLLSSTGDYVKERELIKVETWLQHIFLHIPAKVQELCTEIRIRCYENHEMMIRRHDYWH